MFDHWSGDFSAAQRRVVDPPMPVLVDLSVAFPTDGPFRRDSVSMRIKVGALDLHATVPGLLHAWAQCTDSSWIGLVEFDLPAANGHGHVPARQWACARALSPRGKASEKR